MSDAACRDFIERLDDLLEGRSSPADRRAAEVHLRSCASCRELEGLVAVAGVPIEPPAGFLGAVLARTSGAACAGARARLCDHLDRLLDETNDGLVRMHLDGCEECGRLAAVLSRLAQDLPGLAEREPDARFVPGVLARTSRRAPEAAGWRARLSAGWRRLVYRPRFAWEGAYAGSLLVLLLFGAPDAPFAGVPGKALDLVRSVQVSLPAEAAARQAPRIRSAVRTEIAGATERVHDVTRDLARAVERRSSGAWSGLKQELGTAWDRIASRRTTDDTHKGER
jgi:hypothetical protein